MSIHEQYIYMGTPPPWPTLQQFSTCVGWVHSGPAAAIANSRRKAYLLEKAQYHGKRTGFPCESSLSVRKRIKNIAFYAFQWPPRKKFFSIEWVELNTSAMDWMNWMGWMSRMGWKHWVRWANWVAGANELSKLNELKKRMGWLSWVSSANSTSWNKRLGGMSQWSGWIDKAQ